jgi:hypothetical protein
MWDIDYVQTDTNYEENQALNIRHDVSDVSPVNRDMFLVLLKVSTSGVSPVNRDMFLVL